MAGFSSSLLNTTPGGDDSEGSTSNLPDPQTTKILIGEVNFINSTVIKKMLQKIGYQAIMQVDNGVQAVDAAEKEHFHFIFLALRMPAIGGVEATKLIRKHEKEKQKPKPASIIGLTAEYTEKALLHDNQICYECGMNSVLRMPLHISNLKAVLSACHSRKAVQSLRTLVMMYITNQPHRFLYITKSQNSIFSVQDRKEVFMSSEIMEELHEMKESYPSFYRYPNFEGLDDAEIRCVVLIDYEALKKGVDGAIEAEDLPAVHRCATALAAILKYVSISAESVAKSLSTCKNIEQAARQMKMIKVYMYGVWEFQKKAANKDEFQAFVWEFC